MDVHIPYILPEKYLNKFNISSEDAINMNKKIYEKLYHNDLIRFSSKEINQLIKLYTAEVHYADEMIKDLLNKIDNLDLLQNTLVIVTADHGDEFLEHGDISHKPKLYNELLHIPLIFYSPSLSAGVRIDTTVSLLDLGPTILEILGIRKPNQWIGESLLPLILGNKRSDRLVISEVAFPPSGRKVSIIISPWKYIVTKAGDKDTYELYNLKEDPRELNNLSNKMPKLVKEFSKIASRHILYEEKTCFLKRFRKIKQKILSNNVERTR